MKRSRRLTTLVVAATLLAACGGDDDSSSSDDTASGATEAPDAATIDDTTDDGSAATSASTSDGPAATTGSTEPEAASEGAHDPDAVFRLARHVGAVSFDPHMSPCTCDEGPLTPVYARLVHLSEEVEPVPGLAESWEISDDGLTLTMHLRDGVLFHDGETFDAEAAKANLDRAKTVEGGTQANALRNIESVDVVDDATIQLNLTAPDSALIVQLAMFAGMMISPAAFENPDLDVMPVGAGPYRVVEHRPNDLIVYERFEGYWDPEAQRSAGLEMRVLPDANARFNALRTGEVDATVLLSTELYAQAAETPGIVAEPRSMLSFEGIYVNRTHGELADPLVRQAIAYAIDREALVSGVLGGLEEVRTQPFPPGYFAENPDLPEDLYAYDPEKAKELLAEAGLPDGFSFEMVYPDYNESVASAVRAMLAEVGIDAQIRSVEPGSISAEFLTNQSGDAMLATVSGFPDPSLLFEWHYISGGQGNAGGHSTERMDELHAQIVASAEQAEREALIHEAVAEIMEQALEIPLYSVGAFLGPLKSERVLEYSEGYFGTRLEYAAIRADS